MKIQIKFDNIRTILDEFIMNFEDVCMGIFSFQVLFNSVHGFYNYNVWYDLCISYHPGKSINFLL